MYIRILSNGDTEAKLIPNFYRKIHLKGIHICDSDDNIAFGVVDEHKPSDAHLKGSEDLIRENDKLRKENEFCCLGKDKCQMSPNTFSFCCCYFYQLAKHNQILYH